MPTLFWILLSVLAAGLLYVLVVRRWLLGWGASPAELAKRLPGDAFLPEASSTCTRAITINAPPDRVWPWIAQMGQGRGGFYSYDFLENLAGCDIHSADRVVPGWQDIKIGDTVKLAP